ncbi:uncharacterized protein LOC135845055 [Planococcus citri]|uniref:uncharacterized protein LOC135845055 n=1 Tax=Planococcus citri TaxID=170843 RepID=UPI0031F9E04D
MNFLVWGFIYCLFFINSSAESGLSQDITFTSSRSRVVVFDVDDTLCKERDVRIVFFSAGDKERNFLVIPQLLTSFWGKVKFEVLKAKGQFDIFSKENLRRGHRTFRTGEGNYAKDLKVVIREGETLSDVILVDDDHTYCADDQRPLLVTVNLLGWSIKEEDKKEKSEEGPLISSWDWEEKHSSFYLNSVYFMIGVFKTYFENEKYKILPFREGLNVILPEKNYYNSFFEKHLFAYDMYDLGLSEVQKRVPNAKFYGLRHPEIGTYGNKPWHNECTQQKQVRIANELMEAFVMNLWESYSTKYVK